MAPRPRLALPAALAALALSRGARGFAAGSTSLVEMRRRSLAKTAATPPKKRRNPRRQPLQPEAAPHEPLSKSFLLEALEEALFRQDAALKALDREVERKREEMENNNMDRGVESTSDATTSCSDDVSVATTSSSDDILSAATSKATSSSFHRAEARREELRDASLRLSRLRATLQQASGQLPQQNLERMQLEIGALGYASIFRQPRSSWKTAKARGQEFGRPLGFDGEVFYSPLGVPILVGRMNAYKDDVLRNAAQGSDLWFQVEDYNGARVLLRTSLRRGTEGSRQCRQMAADLAAKYSVWGDEHDSIPVMYTDSRKVAKRGSKVGSMKKRKSLGRMLGYPRNVPDTKQS